MGGKLSCIPKRKKYRYLEDFYSCETEIVSKHNVSSEDAISFDLTTSEQPIIELKDSNYCLVLETPENEKLKNSDEAQIWEHLDFMETENSIPNTSDEPSNIETVVMKNNEETTTEYVVSDLHHTVLDNKGSAMADLLHHQQFLQNIHKSHKID
ncbi:hypothetical protein AVEN_271327-1 [Araneus ventricosus]|uniref:Uncharacterized protein n=1 Tax=Araneus ventricosus TaxID=182803 RepID=A0A4Y2WYP3_ARAVE|nr:hypothetical protein AVEN_271327-1 [Araneus ventricosus]